MEAMNEFIYWLVFRSLKKARRCGNHGGVFFCEYAENGGFGAVDTDLVWKSRSEETENRNRSRFEDWQARIRFGALEYTEIV